MATKEALVSKGRAAGVLVITPQGTPLVREPNKPAPHYWKIPAGKCEDAETVEQCALRELFGEIGVALREEDLKLPCEAERGSHTLTVFLADLPFLPRMRSVGDEGEEIAIFPTADILTMEDFLPSQRPILRKLLASHPLSTQAAK